VLECDALQVAYDRVVALRDVSLRVERGQVVSIVGANGAGKTTLLRTISGLERPRRGRVMFEDNEITRWEPAAIVQSGVSHVPSGRQVFGNMTVMENLRLGAYIRTGDRRLARDVARDLEDVFELFPILQSRMRQAARTLSGGEQQMLAIGRSLMARPRLLLLDEPSLGLAPQALDGILGALQRLNREQGLTILLVEQNAHLALDFATYAYVLETGRIVQSGPTAELKSSDVIVQIYLGLEH
jgi:branched-chain amino acid transport system ATP-binding protein